MTPVRQRRRHRIAHSVRPTSSEGMCVSRAVRTPPDHTPRPPAAHATSRPGSASCGPGGRRHPLPRPSAAGAKRRTSGPPQPSPARPVERGPAAPTRRPAAGSAPLVRTAPSIATAEDSARWRRCRPTRTPAQSPTPVSGWLPESAPSGRQPSGVARNRAPRGRRRSSSRRRPVHRPSNPRPRDEPASSADSHFRAAYRSIRAAVTPSPLPLQPTPGATDLRRRPDLGHRSRRLTRLEPAGTGGRAGLRPRPRPLAPSEPVSAPRRPSPASGACPCRAPRPNDGPTTDRQPRESVRHLATAVTGVPRPRCPQGARSTAQARVATDPPRKARLCRGSEVASGAGARSR
jgi:hypothetical protein